MTDPRGWLRSPRARGLAQVAIVLALVVVAWQVSALSHRATENESTTTAVSGMLARICGVASFAELRKQGLVEECRLAQSGDLPDAIPGSALPSPGEDPTDVNPDVVDDGDAGPGVIEPAPLPEGPTNDQVNAAVDDFFDANPLGTLPGYQSAVKASVANYLTTNPPEPGRPPTDAEIRAAVRTALLANPPADGTDGTDGRGVASAVLDGCDVVFTYSDGATDRVGPLCGPKGDPAPPPTDAQVADAVAAYCNANGECRGPAGPPGVVQTADNCQPADGEFVTDVSIDYAADSQTISISCTTSSALPGLGNRGGP